MLQLHEISKSYGGAPALAPLSLEVAHGETIALLGPSGCGKSTLLRIVVGLIEPDSGEVLLAGEPITPANLRSARHRMGYMIQDGGLFPHLTAAGNAALLARHLNWPAERIEQRLVELAKLTQLPENLLSRYPAQLSGGQQQRVSLMRALFLDPDVLLLDEPLGALDPLIRADLQRQLRSIFQSLKKTVLLVTHDVGEAGYLAESIVLLRSGRVLQRGSLEQLVRQPADPFVHQFVQAQRSPLESL